MHPDVHNRGLPTVFLSGDEQWLFPHDFECAPDEIYELLNDPQFLVDRCLEPGELSAECEVSEDDERTTIELAGEISRDLPKVLARMFDSVLNKGVSLGSSCPG